MKTVLLIDDDPVIRTMLSELLTRAGWRVIEADDGDKGIAMALEHKPEVILCDLLMPRCNGFHVCRTLRARRSVLPNTLIIMTTGRGYATDRLHALESGADEYLIKPIRPQELLKLLDQMTGNGKPAQPIAPTPPVAPRNDDSPEHRTRVRFWGVRGSIPTPGPRTVFYGGNTSCVEVQADGELILLDAGSGIRPFGVNLMAEHGDKPIDLTLLLTHTHWDHIQGFPFFAPAYDAKNKVTILGYEGAKSGLETTLSEQMESSYFPIGLSQMPGHISFRELKDMSFRIGKVDVAAIFVNHPGICVGYKLTTSAGSVAYFPDHEPNQRLRLQPETQPSNAAESLEYAKVEDEKIIRFVQGVDVLITDSQYDVSEYRSHVGWGHSCVDDAVALAVNAKVKRLFLFHHDPSHDDAYVSRMVARAREMVEMQGANIIVEAAREGLEVVLERNRQPSVFSIA